MSETPTQTPARLFSPLTAARLSIGVVGLIAQLVLYGVEWQSGKGYGFAMRSLFLPMAFWATAGVGALALVLGVWVGVVSRLKNLFSLIYDSPIFLVSKMGSTTP